MTYESTTELLFEIDEWARLLMVLRSIITDFMLIISPIYSVINRQKFVGVGIEEGQGLYMHL